MPAPVIRRVLDVSTSHLPEHLGSDVEAGLNGCQLAVCYRLDYGWLMWVPSDPEDSAYSTLGEPDDPDWDDDERIVLAIHKFARALDCDYVLFDSDGLTVDGLPTWEW